MKRKKIAVVLPYFGLGGAEHMIARLVSNIDLSTYKVCVYCVYGEPQNNYLEEMVKEHGIEIIYIKKKKGFSLFAIFRLWRVLNIFGPDIIHTHLSACIYVAPWILMHNVIMLHTVHTMPIYEFGLIHRYIMKIMYFIGKAVPIAISYEIKEQIEKVYKVNSNIELIFNPVILENFAKVALNNRTGKTFISVGRLTDEKNQQLLIQAFRDVHLTIHDSKLIILGDGPKKDLLISLIKKFNLEEVVQLKGAVQNVVDYLGKADIFVLTSLYEGMPLAVLEAMAAGLPIIATNVGGLKEIVTDNGILVESMNKRELVDKMILLMNNKAIRKQYAKSSLRNVKKYDIHEIVSQYCYIYDKYIE